MDSKSTSGTVQAANKEAAGSTGRVNKKTETTTTSKMQRGAEWHPVSRDAFCSSYGNRVELFETQDRERIQLRAFVDTQHPISCFQWGLSSPNNDARQPLPLLALGSSSGSISLADWNRNAEVFVYEAASRRPCTGVAWNKHRPEQLAAGFEKARNVGEFCVAVFDIEHGGKVVFRPVSEEPTASLAWLPHEPHIVAVGTSISWIRIYDTRVGGGGAATSVATASDIMSILAHPATRPRKVKGIRPDALQQHTIASYSDSPGEPIKIWDLRKGAASKPKLMVVQSQVAAVIDVAWSPRRAGERDGGEAALSHVMTLSLSLSLPSTLVLMWHLSFFFQGCSRWRPTKAAL